ncbi:MAG: sigma-70 family RNA polymerase sigma factor [Prolixibacteraceae bacterium]|nr:sigma-70 family RNA polymerase sigma factor [Prolixibacteraceae bacterium]
MEDNKINMLGEKELLRDLQNGDKIVFKQLFNSYQQLVYNVCYHMSNSREEAEDITQDVFIKVLHAIASFKGEAKLSTWIYRIAVNTCLKNESRKKLNQLVSLDFLLKEEQSLHLIFDPETPDQKLEKSETEQIVRYAIQKLSARQKTAVVLHRYENLSYKEIARVIGISVPAVESLLHRAKENLAEKLKKILR